MTPEDYAKSLNVKSTPKRANCPFCGGIKTFTAARVDGTLVWNCYKLSCPVHGGVYVGRTLQDIRNRASGCTTERWHRPLPEILSSPKHHVSAMDFLRRNNSVWAMEQGLAKIRYAPKDDRLLFMQENGAFGRTLRNDTPKWLTYGAAPSIYEVGTCQDAIIVEDCLSACSVSATEQYTGIAILGTHLSTEQRAALKDYKKFIVALDPDASSKAIKMAQELNTLAPSKAVIIPNDLKYLDSKEILRVVS